MMAMIANMENESKCCCRTEFCLLFSCLYLCDVDTCMTLAQQGLTNEHIFPSRPRPPNITTAQYTKYKSVKCLKVVTNVD